MCKVEFPEELVEEILSRLPVQPLLRFRCVSKTWRSLIDSPTFVKSHFSNNPDSKICVFDNPDPANGSIRLAEVNLNFGEVDLHNCPDQVDLLSCPDRLPFKILTLPVSSPAHMEVVGSCNGLICLSRRDRFKKIFLVNPSTREYRLLPPISQQFKFALVFGMGYDGSADEYKVVLISYFQDKVYIYGSKLNTWRQVDFRTESSFDKIFNTSKFFDTSYGVYAHGALHWTISFNKRILCIAAFDLVSEKFTVAEYKENLFGNPDYVLLRVTGGQLCLCCRHRSGKDGEDCTVIWVMKEYGVRESWSILASIDGYAEPLAFSTCGKHLLVGGHTPRSSCCGSFHWYDLDKKFMSIKCTIPERKSRYPNVCQQSLIRLEEKLG